MVAFEGAVVAYDGDDVDGFEALLHQDKKFESDGHERFALLKAVGDVEGHITAIFEDAMDFGNDLIHRGIIGVGRGLMS